MVIKQAALDNFNCTSPGRIHDIDLFSDFFFNSDLNTDSNADLSTHSTTDLQLDSLHDTKPVTQSYLNSHKKPLALAVMLSGLFAITAFTSAHAALSATRPIF